MTTAAPSRTPTTTTDNENDQDRDTALLADYWDPTLTLFDISARQVARPRVIGPDPCHGLLASSRDARVELAIA